MELKKTASHEVPTYLDKVGTFADRLRILVGEKSARSLAVELNISSSGFHQYLTGRSDPGRAVLSSIADKMSVNLDWLVDGRGPMRKSEAQESLSMTTDPQPFMIINLEGRQMEFIPSPDLFHIPILSIEVACGSGTLIPTEAVEAVLSTTRKWIRRELGANPEDISLVKARGDSMTDTIMPEEMVFVDRSCAVEPCDGIWVFRHADALFLKRLQFFPGHKVKVTSDNPRYDSYEISRQNDFTLLGQVIAALPLRKL